MPMPSNAKTRGHTIRISDDVWEAAEQRAERDGVAVSTIVRQSLIAYLGLTGTRGVVGREDRADATDVRWSKREDKA